MVSCYLINVGNRNQWIKFNKVNPISYKEKNKTKVIEKKNVFIGGKYLFLFLKWFLIPTFKKKNYVGVLKNVF